MAELPTILLVRICAGALGNGRPYREPTEAEQDGKRFLLRSAPRPGASLALAALGVALPPTLRPVAKA